MYNIFTDARTFEWDEQKNLENHKKHGVFFSEARTVFLDEYGRDSYDPDHSDSEDRFILAGLSERLRVLVVSYCYRREYRMIRIISVRKATAREEGYYWRKRL